MSEALGKLLMPNEAGTFAQLAARPNPAGLVIVNEPPLEGEFSVLAFRLHRALTCDEMARERDKSPAIALTRTDAEQVFAVRAQRGLS
jgi:hypothetical protein